MIILFQTTSYDKYLALSWSSQQACKCLHLGIMKSKLPIIAALVTIAIGLPAKTDDNPYNRSVIIGALAALDCFAGKGEITEKQSRELMNKHVSENPQLDAAYSWALSSDKAREALQAMAPHMNSDCEYTNPDDDIERLIAPCLD